MKSIFLCESCGKSVSHNAHRCPYCGRFFTAVVCPECRYTGKPKEFMSGCPRCGYFANETKTDYKKKEKGFLLSKKKKPLIEFPLWFYQVAGIVLLALIITIVVLYISSLK